LTLTVDTRRRARVLALTAGVLGLAGCSEEKSYAVVTVRTTEGELAGIAQFLVRVWNGPDRRDRLVYPPAPGPGRYRITSTESIDFSVSFSTSLSGTIRIGVQPLDAQARSLGYGELERPIDPGHSIQMTVAVVRGAMPPPDDVGDAGARPDVLGDSRSVCEPTSPGTCATGRTCYVGCFGMEAAALCTAAGARTAGESCTSNADCEPGAQCLGLGCGSICVRHCKGDGECGVGRCNRTIPCGTQPSSFRFCSQACDPRGGVASGCATGLGCFLFGGDVVTCDCPGPKRLAEEGTNCNEPADCKPGLVCVGMGAAGTAAVCRPICKLADNDCAVGRTCTLLRNPDFTVWGACLPVGP
jgi:hypothetical protein